MDSGLFRTYGMGIHSHAYVLCNCTVLAPMATMGVKQLQKNTLAAQYMLSQVNDY